MLFPLWVIYGFIAGFIGYALEPSRRIDTLVSSLLLGLAGAFQGYLISTILKTIPVANLTLSPIIFSFAGALLLLSLGKITKRAFQ